MTTRLRDSARDIFHRVLYHPALGPARRGMLASIGRVRAHLLNCSTDSRANGEEWLIGQLPSSGVFVDVGFNRGNWTRAVLSKHPAAFVHAFDPCRDVGEFASRLDLDPNHFAFHGIALSNEIGTATFHDYGAMNESNSLADRSNQVATNAAVNTYEVDVLTLDEWAKTLDGAFVDVLKIDAEGFDLHVMEGAKGLLDAQRIDLIVFEYASGWFVSRRTLGEAYRFLTERGYAIYRLFPFFLAPYRYEGRHEGSLIGYYVALSQRCDGTGIPRREIDL